MYRYKKSVYNNFHELMTRCVWKVLYYNICIKLLRDASIDVIKYSISSFQRSRVWGGRGGVAGCPKPYEPVF